MEYFNSVVEFFNAHIINVLILFIIATIVETIVFITKRVKAGVNDSSRKDEITDNYFVAILSNVTAIIGAYAIACIVVGAYNYIPTLDWAFFSNYMAFLKGETAGDLPYIIGLLVFIVATIVYMIKSDIDSLFWRFICAAIVAAVTVAAVAVAGFIVYVVVAILIKILTLLWFFVKCFAISSFHFVGEYWKPILAVILIPGVVGGAISAIKSYFKGLKKAISTSRRTVS